ncbi:hypothetical protein ACJ77P_06810 [Syntrophus buswellii]|jgi:hypothetical protein|uniref:hypothetical protein n=1 Tax=Syntrophus TaxID=43773 RepID=UPI00345E2EEF
MKAHSDRKLGGRDNRPLRRCIVLLAALLVLISLSACGASVGQTLISQPDEFTYTYEAKEKFVLRAIERVLKEKKMGTNIRIDEEKHLVESDFVVLDDWRTRSLARTRTLNWKETEVTLSVVAEKKTPSGWEMRRLLEKEQYTKIFDTIDLKIYEEMYRTQ